MNFMEYVCRGIVRSEDSIRRLNKNVNKLAKCTRNISTSVICLGIAGMLTISVVAMQDQEIKALKKQVADLAKSDVANNVEVSEEQEGA